MSTPTTEVRRPLTFYGALKNGTIVAASASASEFLSCLGASRIRFRVKASAAATVSFAFALADGSTLTTLGNPYNRSLLANTELLFEIPCEGQDVLQITFTAGGAPSTITFIDVVLLPDSVPQPSRIFDSYEIETIANTSVALHTGQPVIEAAIQLPIRARTAAGDNTARVYHGPVTKEFLAMELGQSATVPADNLSLWAIWVPTGTAVQKLAVLYRV